MHSFVTPSQFRKTKQVSAGTMLLEQTLALTSQFERPRGGVGMEDADGVEPMDMQFNPAPLLVARSKTKLSEVQLEYATVRPQCRPSGMTLEHRQRWAPLQRGSPLRLW
jgi:hypothetical protein